MEPGKDGAELIREKAEPIVAKGLLMGVQGLPTLLGPELLKDSGSLLWGCLSGLWGLSMCPEGLDTLEGKAVEDLSQPYKVGAAQG